MASKRKAETFQVALTPRKKTKNDKSENEGHAIVILAPFQPQGKIIFENIKVGSSCSREVIVSNPEMQNRNIQIEFELEDKDKNGYIIWSWSKKTLVVDSGKSEKVILTWQPVEAGNWHIIIPIKEVLLNNLKRRISQLTVAASSFMDKVTAAKRKNESAKAKALLNTTAAVVKPLQDKNIFIGEIDEEQNQRRVTYTIPKKKFGENNPAAAIREENVDPNSKSPNRTVTKAKPKSPSRTITKDKPANSETQNVKAVNKVKRTLQLGDQGKNVAGNQTNENCNNTKGITLLDNKAEEEKRKSEPSISRCSVKNVNLDCSVIKITAENGETMNKKKLPVRTTEKRRSGERISCGDETDNSTDCTSEPVDKALTGKWNISPPKRVKKTPESDSPIVLPAPSRNLPRRSTRNVSTMERPFTATNSSRRSYCDPRVVKSAVKNKPHPITIPKVPRAKLNLGFESESNISLLAASVESIRVPRSPHISAHPVVDLSGNPFSQRCAIFLDNQWIDDREKELLKWVNAMLSPPQELEANCLMPTKADLLGISIKGGVKPTAKQYRLNSVRRAALSLLSTEKISTILTKVHVAVDKGVVSVRNDRDLHRDIGLQDAVMKLLFCFHPLWLRVALETVYGQVIHLHSNSDVAGLANFIRKRLLSDDYIKDKYSHHSVPFHMLPEFKDNMKRFTLEKFLMVIFFLDTAKQHKLINHDPCLFCKDSPYKDSKSILMQFTKELLKGGDVSKYLSTFGYNLKHKQTYLEEFDLKVKSRDCLRDGVRLARLVEVLLGCEKTALGSKLRLPAVSRLQKIHNVEVALNGYCRLKNEAVENYVTAKDIVDGHREKILSLLWQLRGVTWSIAAIVIQKFWIRNKVMIKDRMRFHKMKKSTIKIQRWFRRLKSARNPDRKEFLKKKSAAITIQRKFRAVLEMRTQVARYEKMKHAAVKIQMWFRLRLPVKIQRTWFLKIKRGVKFIEEKRLATLSARVQRDSYVRIRSATIVIQKYWKATLLMRKQRATYLKQRATVLFIEEKRLATICAREDLAEYRRVRSSAILIQRKWRACVLMRTEKTRYMKLKQSVRFVERKRLAVLEERSSKSGEENQISAVTFIQRKWKATLLMRKERLDFLQIKKAVLNIENRRIAQISMRKEMNNRAELKLCAIRIQKKWRATLLMRKERLDFLDIKKAVLNIENRRIAQISMRKEMKNRAELKLCAIRIQKKWRATLLMRKERLEFLEIKKAVLNIESRKIAQIAMKKEMSNYAKLRLSAIIIQKKWRATLLMRKERLDFLVIKKAVLNIENQRIAQIAMKKEMNNYAKLRLSAIIIQKKWRATLLMRKEQLEFKEIKKAVLNIESRKIAQIAMKKEMNNYAKLRLSAIIIQKKWRATLLMRKEQLEFKEIKKAVLNIESRKIAQIAMKKEMNNYAKLRLSAIIIQRKWKATLLMRHERARFLQVKSAVALVESKIIARRSNREELKNAKKFSYAVIYIQQKWKATKLMWQERRRFLELKSAAMRIQAAWRGYLTRKQYNLKLKDCTRKLTNDGKTLRKYKDEASKITITEKRLSVIKTYLRNLNVITINSPELSLELVQEGVVQTLHCILRERIRSEPEQDATKLGTIVLVNLAKQRKTEEAVWQISLENEACEMLLWSCLNFCKSNEGIFCATITLLWLWAQERERRQVIQNQENFKYVMKNVNAEMSKVAIKRKTKISKTMCPSRRPNWGLSNNKLGPNVFTDPLIAWQQFVKCFD